MLEELERWEEAEIKEMNEEDSKKSINTGEAPINNNDLLFFFCKKAHGHQTL